MNVLFYVRMPGDREAGLLSAVAPLVSRGSLEVFADFRAFAGRIREPKETPSIALIWNPSREDLLAILSLQDFLRGIRILLALPDQEKETVALAHRIRPAYITYVDDGISGIVSVLKRLTGSASGDEAGARGR